MSNIKKDLGFSLIELISVIVMLGIISFFALPKLRVSDSSVMTSRDMIIAALSHVQQVAMARDSVSNPVTIVFTSSSFDVRENGVSINFPGASYPFSLPNGVVISSGIGTMNYDKLGKTSPVSISLNSGSAVITVEESGYAY
ncbi:MAG: prepilin-type N-terminal cleavage/methylation domain-containing protein [Cellvibrionaceae bacterium]